MKKLTLLSLIIAISVCAALIGRPAGAAVADWQKGISIQSRYSTDFGSVTFRQSVDKAAQDGVNFVTLVVAVHQDTVSSSYVYTGSDTSTDDALRSGLSYIKSKGLSSAIAVHDNTYDNQWRAYINASDKDAWFASYGALINRYAAIGQSVGMSQLVIGTELSSMTVPANTSRWVSLIQSVRQRFSGTLTYSAQRTGYMSDAGSLGFWPQLDKIGISAYYGLGSDTSPQALENAWNTWNQQEISVLAAKYNKPVIFTEVGYVSRDGATNDPGTGYALGTPINTTVQANAYQALFSYWDKYSTVQGVFLWDWSSDPNAGGSNNGDYTPQNKSAETVMKTWYTTTGSGSPTLITPPASSYSVKSASVTNVTVGTQVSLPVQFAANGSASSVLIDLEIYNASGTRIAQTFADNQTLTPSDRTYTISWIPTSSGTYTVRAGVFAANWSKNFYWNNNLSSVSVSSAVVTPTPPVVTPPVPPVTQPVPPTPTAPSTVLPTEIAIWWPGGSVTGIQPFKAIINGRDSSTYDLYWQVDGGVLNKLGDDPSPISHKESLVDLTNWRWNASKQYMITFVAKDKAGAILSQKTVTITIPS